MDRVILTISLILLSLLAIYSVAQAVHCITCGRSSCITSEECFDGCACVEIDRRGTCAPVME